MAETLDPTSNNEAFFSGPEFQFDIPAPTEAQIAFGRKVLKSLKANE